MKILTVLKTSDTYKKEYVDLIYAQCQKYAKDIDFICISDDPSVPGYVKMEHDWPRWWPKMEIFKFEGPVLYLDLDTIIVNDITKVLESAKGKSFIALRDFYKNAKMQRTVGSGIMYWEGNFRYLYDIFAENPDKHMKECNNERWWGDQGFIEKYLKTEPVYWQDIVTNKIVSWKVHCKTGVPKEAVIVAFHGNPKPWHVKISK